MTTGTMMVCSQGVKLKVVEAVLDKAQGQGLVTTQDVHDMLISPATADAGCAYIDTLNDSLKGPATCIVSHAWASPWQDTVDVMRQVEAETPNTLFWLDLLVSNHQSGTSAQSDEWWSTTYRQHILHVGSVAVVATPWLTRGEGGVLSRTWCLFELLVACLAVDTVDLRFYLPSSADALFVDKLLQDFVATGTATRCLDVQRSTAFHDHDKAAMLRVIEAWTGTKRCNTLVSKCVEKWLLHEATLVKSALQLQLIPHQVPQQPGSFPPLPFARYSTALALLEPTVVQYAELCCNLGRAVLNFSDGHPDDLQLLQASNSVVALDHFDQALTALSTTPSNHQSQLLEASLHNQIGIAHAINSRLDSALKHHREALRLQQHALGKDHPDTCTTYNSMAAVLGQQGHLDQAMECYDNVLALQQISPESKGSLAVTSPTFVLMRMAHVLEQKGDLAGSLKLCEQALAVRRSTLGEEHEATASTYVCIGDLHSHMGNSAAALACFSKALDIVTKLVGDRHPQTADLHDSMALVYLNNGNSGKAIEHHATALSILSSSFGADHSSLITTHNNLGNAFYAQGRMDEAREHYTRAFTMQRNVLGEDHPETAILRSNVAMVLGSMGQLDMALQEYQRVLASQLATLGDIHHTTGLTFDNIAHIYERQGDVRHALKFYNKALVAFQATIGADDPSTKMVLYRIQCFQQGE
eukprot:m.33702 g.33702  ORF g.33702 m.33702 type:complete len:699 (-) comp9656_c0_seq1:297-2393(-)